MVNLSVGSSATRLFSHAHIRNRFCLALVFWIILCSAASTMQSEFLSYSLTSVCLSNNALGPQLFFLTEFMGWNCGSHNGLRDNSLPSCLAGIPHSNFYSKTGTSGYWEGKSAFMHFSDFENHDLYEMYFIFVSVCVCYYCSICSKKQIWPIFFLNLWNFLQSIWLCNNKSFMVV